MYTKITYKFKKDDVIGLACGYEPKDCEILEEIKILYAEQGFELFKGEEKIGSAVQLKDGDKKESYKELPILNEDEEVEGGEEQ